MPRAPAENARPLELIGQAYVPRLLIGAIFVPLVYAASSIFPLAEDDGIPFFFYATCFIVVLAGNVAATVMFNAQMSFFAKIADAEIGATYMTCALLHNGITLCPSAFRCVSTGI